MYFGNVSSSCNVSFECLKLQLLCNIFGFNDILVFNSHITFYIYFKFVFFIIDFIFFYNCLNKPQNYSSLKRSTCHETNRSKTVPVATFISYQNVASCSNRSKACHEKFHRKMWHFTTIFDTHSFCYARIRTF